MILAAASGPLGDKDDYIGTVGQRELEQQPGALLAAVIESPGQPVIPVQVYRDDEWGWVTIRYAEGITIERLVRDPEVPDRLTTILHPRTRPAMVEVQEADSERQAAETPEPAVESVP